MWFSTRWRADGLLTAWLAVMLLVGSAAPAWANPRERLVDTVQSMPTTVSHAFLPGSLLKGEASLRYWGMLIYHARLWTLPSLKADQLVEHPLVLELEYKRDLYGESIADRSLAEMRRAGPIPEPQARQWLAQMQRIFPDIKAGDLLTGHHQPGQGVTFWHNHRSAGRIDDPEFSRRFFGIWLAPTTSQPDMRTALLGLNSPSKR